MRSWILFAGLALFPFREASAQERPLSGELTTRLSIAPVAGAHYRWEIYSGRTADFARGPGDCTGDGACFVGGIDDRPTVEVRWLRTGVFFYKSTVIGPDGCMNFKIGRIEVGDLSGPSAELTCELMPNPAGGSQVAFRITPTHSTRLVVDLFAPNGQLVARAFGGEALAGSPLIVSCPNLLPQGVYLYRVQTDREVVAGKLAVVRVF